MSKYLKTKDGSIESAVLTSVVTPKEEPKVERKEYKPATYLGHRKGSLADAIVQSVNEGLSAGQKKLPPALQKAILAKQGKKEVKEEDAYDKDDPKQKPKKEMHDAGKKDKKDDMKTEMMAGKKMNAMKEPMNAMKDMNAMKEPMNAMMMKAMKMPIRAMKKMEDLLVGQNK